MDCPANGVKALPKVFTDSSDPDTALMSSLSVVRLCKLLIVLCSVAHLSYRYDHMMPGKVQPSLSFAGNSGVAYSTRLKHIPRLWAYVTWTFK